MNQLASKEKVSKGILNSQTISNRMHIPIAGDDDVSFCSSCRRVSMSSNIKHLVFPQWSPIWYEPGSTLLNFRTGVST